MGHGEDSREGDSRRAVLRLGVLFAALYFVQGIGEPTEGMIGQPVKAWLVGQGAQAGSVASFTMALAVPWMIKPVYGVLTDFVPLFGYRRRSYLLLATGVTAVGLLALSAGFTPDMPRGALLIALLLPAVGIAVTDVVVDAVMVERGQRLGMTGRFQSVQWAAVYAAAVVAAPIGGLLAKRQRVEVAFLIAGLAAAASFVAAYVFVRESPRPREAGAADRALKSLGQAAAAPGLPLVAGFLFLWNFNPFLNDVLYVHLKTGLGIGDEDYGWSQMAMSLASVAASVAYGFYCRRVPFGLLLHVSVALGVLSTVGYFLVSGPRSATAAMACLGFTYMTAVMIQFDLMARACPAAVAGTAFAILMSVTNVSLTTAVTAGGHLYDFCKPRYGAEAAFRATVAVGAVCSLGCWLFVPALRRAVARTEAATTDQ